MGKSIFDFADENTQKKDGKTQNAKLDSLKKEISEDEYNNLNKKVNKYGSLSQDQLLKELSREVQKSKTEGNFDYDRISSMAKNMESFLSKEQSEMLQKLINSIK